MGKYHHYYTQNGRYNLEEEIQFLGFLLIQLCGWWLHYLFLSKSNLAEEPTSLQQQSRPGRMSLFSASEAFLSNSYCRSIVSQHTDITFIKTSTDNSHWQTARCSDNQISWSLYTSEKAYVNLVLQATLPAIHRKGLTRLPQILQTHRKY